MKKVLFSGFGLIMLACFTLGASSDTTRRAIAETLYGMIYYTEYRGEANYSVYVTDGGQDLNVWETDIPGIATEPGVWHITPNAGEANYIVYISDIPVADLYIRYVSAMGEAGVAN